MGRHAAPGPPDERPPERTTPEPPAPQPPAPETPAPELLAPETPTPETPGSETTAAEPAPTVSSSRRRRTGAEADADPGPATPAAPAEDHTPGLIASLVLGLAVGLVTAGVLWWAGQPPLVVALVGVGALAVVVLATWVARSIGGTRGR